MTDHDAFLATVAESPDDEAPVLIYSDWLRDNGADEFAAQEVHNPPTWNQYLPATYYGIGVGRGSGSGIGSGIGSGSGSVRGIGSGSGSVRGRGSGSVRGIGSGSGRGRGIRTKTTGDAIMEPGKNYIILTVDWYAWVGRCVRRVGPYEFEFEQVSKFDTNAGDVFGEIAAGDKRLRDGCTYQHFTTKAILGLGRVGVFEWAGKLPQEYDPKFKGNR